MGSRGHKEDTQPRLTCRWPKCSSPPLIADRFHLQKAIFPLFSVKFESFLNWLRTLLSHLPRPFPTPSMPSFNWIAEATSSLTQQQQHHSRRERRDKCAKKSPAKLLLLVLLLSHINSVSSTSSSPKVPFASSEERLLLRNIFLRKFGLESLGARMQNESKHSGERERRRVPNYIWTIYERHSANPEAETIRHYTPNTYSVNRTDSGEVFVRMAFNLSATGRDPYKEQIVRAELRLPEMRANGTMRVYKVEKSGEVPSSEKGIECGDREWMDVSALLEEDSNEQVYLALSFPSTGATPEEFGSMALIIYADGEERTTEKEKNVDKRRSKRWVNSQQSGEDTSSSAAAENSSRQRKHRTHRRPSSKQNAITGGQCRRAELYVDFGELNWNDWIMAPAGYEAYQCRGRCTHPMPSNLNTTNHAIVQSLMHSIDPSAVAAPSCVPVKMSAISILYKDVNNVIVVKTYADMRVDACGCH